MSGLSGVEKVNDFGQMQEIQMTKGSDPQSLLSEIISRTRITRFELAKPSLHHIFVRIASPEKEVSEDA